MKLFLSLVASIDGSDRIPIRSWVWIWIRLKLVHTTQNFRNIVKRVWGPVNTRVTCAFLSFFLSKT